MKILNILFISLLITTVGYSQSAPSSPIDFQDTVNIAHALAEFGGCENTAIVVDPTNSSNLVVRTTKRTTAQTWGGIVIADAGLASPIDFTTTTKISIRVWSATANTPILLKVEDKSNGAIASEVLMNTTMAGAWETLEFDFVNGTPALNLSSTYDKIAFFPNFGNVPAADETYYLDDIVFTNGGGGSGSTKVDPDLPITFEDTATVNYNLADFGGNVTAGIVVDPTDPNNLVVESTKEAGAEVWAGTTAGGSGIATAIPFSATDTKMYVRVWSPAANTPILLKVEDKTNPAVSVETLTNTTMAQTWETLEFDFANHATGTSPLDLNATYDKVSIFFNFGTSPAANETYYWDDVAFGAPVNTTIVNAADFGVNVFPNPAQDHFTVNFDEVFAQPVILNIFDVQGKLVQQQMLTNQQTTISTSTLENGFYIVRMDSEERVYTQKLLIAK